MKLNKVVSAVTAEVPELTQTADTINTEMILIIVLANME